MVFIKSQHLHFLICRGVPTVESDSSSLAYRRLIGESCFFLTLFCSLIHILICDIGFHFFHTRLKSWNTQLNNFDYNFEAVRTARVKTAAPIIFYVHPHTGRRASACIGALPRYGQYPLHANYPRDIAPPRKLGRLGGVLTSWLADQLAPARIVVMNQKGQRHGPRPRAVCWLVTAWIRAARICIKLKFPNFMQIQKRSQAAPELAPRRKQSQRALRGELLASHTKWMEAANRARSFACSGYWALHFTPLSYFTASSASSAAEKAPFFSFCFSSASETTIFLLTCRSATLPMCARGGTCVIDAPRRCGGSVFCTWYLYKNRLYFMIYWEK